MLPFLLFAASVDKSPRTKNHYCAIIWPFYRNIFCCGDWQYWFVCV